VHNSAEDGVEARGPRHVVAIVAHPDDEAWALGGTLAVFARRGHTVTVLAATSGEAGWIHGKRGVADAAALRRAELSASCQVLGANVPEFMGWSDGGLANLDSDQAIAALRARLHELAPDVIVGLGPDGGYGHIDHTVLCRFVRDAARGLVSPLDGCDVPILEAAFAPGQLASVRATIARFAPALLDPCVTEVGVAASQSDVRVDIRAVAAVKQAAVACHVSQMPAAGPLAFLGGTVAELMTSERFAVVGGQPPRWLAALALPDSVLHVTRDLAPRVNGGISVAVAALIRAEHRPLVVSFDGWRAHRRDGAQTEPTKDVLGDANVVRIDHPDHLDAAHAFAVQAGPSAVVVHHAMLWPFAAAIAARLSLPAPDVYVHVLQADLDAARGLDEPTASLRAERSAIAAATRVVVPSRSAAAAVAKMYPSVAERLRIRPLAPDALVDMPNVATKEKAMNGDGGTGVSKTVLYAGRFADIKGTADLFEAIADVLPHHENIRFVVAGGIPDNPKGERRWQRKWRQRWPAAVAERVDFVGWMRRDELLDAMKRATVVVIPSRIETLGLVAVEARAVRTCIVASDIPALRETLTHAPGVHFVPPARPDLLAAAINAVVGERR